MASAMAEHALANILIIEDDPQQVWFYSKALRGYRLTCVPNASAALIEIKQSLPDLIILDHVLAGGELGVGPEAQNGRSEHMGAGMADALQVGHFLAVVEGFAFVFHKLS